MILPDEIYEIGKFQKTHALKGELNMISDIDASYFSEGNPLIVECDGIFVPFYAESLRSKGSTSYLIKLENINSEKEASEFVNHPVYMLKKDMERFKVETEEYDDSEFIGYSIEDAETLQNIGIIDDIDDSTSNILFMVKAEGMENPVYIPANEDLIVEIDEENKKIIMNLPAGLLDINEKGKSEIV